MVLPAHQLTIPLVHQLTKEYQSAGRLPIGSQGSIECQSGLPPRTPPRHFVALSPSRGAQERYGTPFPSYRHSKRSEEWSVDQLKGRPFYGQAKGQLWSTRVFYAECAQYKPLMMQMLLNAGRREGYSILFLDFIRYEQHSDELATSGGFSPFGALRHHLCHGVKRVTRFSGRYAPLRIVFPCHPAVRGHNNPCFALCHL